MRIQISLLPHFSEAGDIHPFRLGAVCSRGSSTVGRRGPTASKMGPLSLSHLIGFTLHSTLHSSKTIKERAPLPHRQPVCLTGFQSETFYPSSAENWQFQKACWYCCWTGPSLRWLGNLREPRVRVQHALPNRNPIGTTGRRGHRIFHSRKNRRRIVRLARVEAPDCLV